jgi:hypothetical protein
MWGRIILIAVVEEQPSKYSLIHKFTERSKLCKTDKLNSRGSNNYQQNKELLNFLESIKWLIMNSYLPLIIRKFMTESNLGKWQYVHDGHGKIFTIE